MQMSGLSRRLCEPSPYLEGTKWASAERCAIRLAFSLAFSPLGTCFGFATNHQEISMAVDGNWNITMSTPMGDRQTTLSVKSAGGALTGTQEAEGNSVEIFDGKASGDDLSWKVSITSPMPLTLEFTGKVSGDSISGEMGIGPMGSFPFTGTRV